MSVTVLGVGISISHFLKKSHQLGLNFSPASLSFWKTALNQTRWSLGGFWKCNDFKIEETLIKPKVNQTCFHQPLECSLDIHQPERHTITFVKSQWTYSECHQWFGCLIHLNLPIASPEVWCDNQTAHLSYLEYPLSWGDYIDLL